MAINTIADLSTTAASNTDYIGQSTAGTALASTLDTIVQNLGAIIGRAYQDMGGLPTVGGTANAITLTTLSTYQALEMGLLVAFKAASANTGATTINVDSLGAKAIRRQGDAALTAGDLAANGRYLLQYDTAYNGAAGAWVLMNQTTSGDVTLTGTQTLTNKTLTSPTVTTPTLTLKQSTTPTPTAEGDIQWDTDDNVLAIGDGAATKLFVPIPASTAAGDIEYFSGAKVTSRLAVGTASQVLAVNAGATAPEWVTPTTGGMTLIGTLTTTSGTTQSQTSIAAGYRSIYCELDAVSAGTNVSLTLALSSTNGAAYGSAVTISGAIGGSAGTLSGSVWVDNVSSTLAAGKVARPALSLDGADPAVGNVAIGTNSAAVVNAIRFAWTAGGSFDAGSIRIYGVK